MESNISQWQTTRAAQLRAGRRDSDKRLELLKQDDLMCPLDEFWDSPTAPQSMYFCRLLLDSNTETHVDTPRHDEPVVS
jgi:hypothetical protein